MRILFQGDSITDAGRDKRNYFDLGSGYPKYAAQLIKENNPNADIEFINLGLSGNRTDQLFDRLYPDAIALQPDVISILIGINDVWHRHESSKIMTTDEQFEVNYRTILTHLREKTSAKILMLSPYLLDSEQTAELRPDVDKLIPIVKNLADEFADAYIPLDELFANAITKAPEKCYYSEDGVHPNDNGAKFIGKLYAEELQKII